MCEALGAGYLADGSVDLIPDGLDEAERLDAAMRERQHLLGGVEPTADEVERARLEYHRREADRDTGREYVLPGLIGLGLLLAALAINAIVGGGT